MRTPRRRDRIERFAPEQRLLPSVSDLYDLWGLVQAGMVDDDLRPLCVPEVGTDEAYDMVVSA